MGYFNMAMSGVNLGIGTGKILAKQETGLMTENFTLIGLHHKPNLYGAPLGHKEVLDEIARLGAESLPDYQTCNCQDDNCNGGDDYHSETTLGSFGDNLRAKIKRAERTEVFLNGENPYITVKKK